ncbi:hypothetical protein BKH41_08555 [Helicobacter sp. 12S02232-10]|uniref:nucleotidyl transferase AbiEii/AbiGii toxin family protein n=1 Tax=Helicobacter sp. 12S02232-10 TaxID=1476197 RepID=UPI000BA734FC|nr:nucleotidyl transferase AbiEii/AbiGii toxin family protein [Helicobacter sp. 12S02232-10]PAF46750.1 hypothetical protein BKH41_08555 [Helicobacter sp. 12S02232-10]
MFYKEILPKEQQEILQYLKPITDKDFILFGGTAIALQLGHRVSVDFDFFRSEPLDQNEKTKISNLNFLNNFTTLQNEENTFVISVNGVKLSFFGGIDFVKLSKFKSFETLKIAQLEDLLATKLAVITQRVEYKDYIDVIHIINNGLSLQQGFKKAKEFYGNQLSIQDTLKTLIYFEGGDLYQLKDNEKEVLTKAVYGFNKLIQDKRLENTKQKTNPYEAVNIPMDEILLKLGYEYKREKCTKRNFTMENQNGDLVVISRMSNDHYLYFNPFNDNDRGNIHSFCKNRGVSLKEILYANTFEYAHKLQYTDPKEKESNSLKAIFEFEKFREAKGNSNYLEFQRGISRKISEAFNIKLDDHNNVCFPHYCLEKIPGFKKGEKDLEFICQSGYTLKFRNPLFKDRDGNPLNKPIKSLCYGGKGLEILKSPDCTHLSKVQNIIITESSIDSLSFFELKKERGERNFDFNNTLLCATGGNKNESTTKVLEFIRDRATEATFILAMDQDEKGKYFTEQLKELLKGRKIKEEYSEFKDFNDDLRAFKIISKDKLNLETNQDLKKSLENKMCQILKDLKNHRINPKQREFELQKLEVIKTICPFNRIQDKFYQEIVQEKELNLRR